MNATSGAPSRSFQSSPAPDHNQTVSPTEELYSTSPHPDDASLARDEDERHEHENGETRKEYAGSSGSSSASETHSPIRPTPPQRKSSNQQQFHHAHAPPLHYPQHQPPLFYNSTSHASMPLSPPSLFNLVPGGSPSFTYHHSFPTNPAMPASAGAQHYQPPQSSNSYSTFAPPPPPQGYTNGFGLGVGTEDGAQYGMGPGMGMSMGAPRRNPSPGFQIDADDDEMYLLLRVSSTVKRMQAEFFPYPQYRNCYRDQIYSFLVSERSTLGSHGRSPSPFLDVSHKKRRCRSHSPLLPSGISAIACSSRFQLSLRPVPQSRFSAARTTTRSI